MGALVIWGTAGVILEMRKMYKTVFECSGGGGGQDLQIFIKTLEYFGIWCLYKTVFVGQFFVCVFFLTALWIYLQTYILESDGWSLIAAWNIIKPLLLLFFLNRSGKHRKSAVSLKLMWHRKKYTLYCGFRPLIPVAVLVCGFRWQRHNKPHQHVWAVRPNQGGDGAVPSGSVWRHSQLRNLRQEHGRLLWWVQQRLWGRLVAMRVL